MTITTYDELKAAIADFLNRDDLTSTIPAFIHLAEAQINRDVRHWRMEARYRTTSSERYITPPPDWLETMRLSIIGTKTYELSLISQADLASRKELNDTSGTPQYYAVTGGVLELYPAPSASVVIEMSYAKRIPALSDSNQTNWVLEYAPDAYLYGALVHAAPYLHDDARLQTFAAMAQSATNALTAESDRSKYSGSGLRMKITGLS